MTETAISANELSFSYPQVPVLENATFRIQAGEFIGIFGPNGGGKTTLLKLLIGLLVPNQGTLEILGGLPKNRRTDIGYVPQSIQLDRTFPISVLEAVLMGCLSHLTWWGGYPKSCKEQAYEALKQVGLEALAKRPFGTLSGGQAQRVLIARAIVNHPKILFLDEPTANIDLRAQQEICQLLTEFTSHMTVLMVTHDLQLITGKADRFLYVHQRVAAIKPQEVCEHFALGLYHNPLSTKDHFQWK